MTNEIKKVQNTPVANMKNLLMNKGMQEMFKNALEENANAFMASIIDVYSSDNKLAECEPKDVAMEALKAATLKLPINKSLGLAYIVPYNKSVKQGNQWIKIPQPQMQIGYKGYIQLAMRTGQYKNLNANIVYEGMEVEENYLTGEIKITGRPTSDNPIGYFCYFSLLNGFEKILYMTREEIEDHAKKFSKTFSFDGSAWKTDFDAMALKTVIRLLISKYGPMSTELEKVVKDEEDAYLEATVTDNANIVELESGHIVDTETGEVIEEVEVEVVAPF